MTLIDDRIEVAAEKLQRRSLAPGSDMLLELDPFAPPSGFTPVAEINARSRVAVSGTVTSSSVCAWAGGLTLEATIEDPTGSLVLAFLGRRQVGGVHVGSHLVAAGTVVLHRDRPILMNPHYWLVVVADLPICGRGQDPASKTIL